MWLSEHFSNIPNNELLASIIESTPAFLNVKPDNFTDENQSDANHMQTVYNYGIFELIQCNRLEIGLMPLNESISSVHQSNPKWIQRLRELIPSIFNQRHWHLIELVEYSLRHVIVARKIEILTRHTWNIHNYVDECIKLLIFFRLTYPKSPRQCHNLCSHWAIRSHTCWENPFA